MCIRDRVRAGYVPVVDLAVSAAAGGPSFATASPVSAVIIAPFALFTLFILFVIFAPVTPLPLCEPGFKFPVILLELVLQGLGVYYGVVRRVGLDKAGVDKDLAAVHQPRLDALDNYCLLYTSRCV